MMSKRVRRILPLALTLTLCCLPIAAHAGGFAGARMAPVQDLGGWFANAWRTLVGVWGDSGGSIDPNGGQATMERVWANEGGSIDPNGGNKPTGGATSGTPTGTGSGSGPSIDPSGND